jgi:CheY-like chemotaxis protein
MNKPGKILLIEDSLLSLAITQHQLSSLGYQIDTFTTGLAALNSFQQTSEDYLMVILDIGLPDINGFDLAKLLREFLKGKKHSIKIPIIAISAQSKAAVESQLIDAEIDVFLSKPVDPEILKKITSDLIAKSK